MYSLSVIAGAAVWAFLYNTEEAANAAVDALSANGALVAGSVSFKDDYGQAATLKCVSIGGWLLENLDDTKLAHIKRALHHHRIQIEATKAANADPGLRMGGGGNIVSPHMLSPFGPNGRN
jgi:hypothetical protein